MTRLRKVLDEAVAANGYSAGDLTVLALQNDPFRVDTPARHRDGEWLAGQIAENLGNRRIHTRGLHYMLLGKTKPNGEEYTNTDPDWHWLEVHASKAARWLGYIPFDQIVDARNAEPEVQDVYQRAQPWFRISSGIHLEIPEIDDIVPEVWLQDFTGVQPFRLVLFGEKSSLRNVLGPISSAYRADLYLPAGELTDALLYRMASVGAEDGRRMIVLCFSDCDPSGWQMPVSIARKLQGFRALQFPGLDFEVHPVALTPDQVKANGLPSTPLKDTERRADKWQQAMRVEQTEIDALATLNPTLLRRIAREALNSFFDWTLARRVEEAQTEWIRRAQASLDEQLEPEQLDNLSSQAQAKLDTLRQEINALNAALRAAVREVEIPELPQVPQPEIDPVLARRPLVNSDWGFAEGTRRLIAHKAYEAMGS